MTPCTVFFEQQILHNEKNCSDSQANHPPVAYNDMVVIYDKTHTDSIVAAWCFNHLFKDSVVFFTEIPDNKYLIDKYVYILGVDITCNQILEIASCCDYIAVIDSFCHVLICTDISDLEGKTKTNRPIQTIFSWSKTISQIIWDYFFKSPENSRWIIIEYLADIGAWKLEGSKVLNDELEKQGITFENLDKWWKGIDIKKLLNIKPIEYRIPNISRPDKDTWVHEIRRKQINALYKMQFCI